MSRPQRRLLPPIYFFGAVAIMTVLDGFFPVWQVVDGPWRWLGLIPIAAGAAVAAIVSKAFGKRKTTIRPFEESSALVTGGLFRFSRNPIYVGMMLVLAGVAWLLGGLSPWFVLPLFFFLIDRRFVRVEESMLTERFGRDYVDYRRRVGRWLGSPAVDTEDVEGRKRRRWGVIVVVVLAHTLGLISSVHAVMSTRTSQGAVAWAVSLNAVPYVAVPAYWVFGRNKFNGYIVARRLRDEESHARLREIEQSLAPYRVSTFERPEAARAAEGLAELPMLQGNAVELLVDGEATFESILAGIDAARDYILFQFYIVRDDDLGRRIKSHLVAKARAGVRVRFLYDEVGSQELPRGYATELREAGVEVYDFHTRQGPNNRFQINFRNHRKVVVVDGITAWIGGHNVGDEYLGLDPAFGNWRDTHVRIDGPAALAAQLSFAEDWYWATRELPELNWTPVPAEEGTARVLIVPTGPADELETASLMFVHAINSARERIWIASPYFVPDESVMSALQLAGLRGVDVRILIPENPDHKLVWLAAFSYFDDARRTGVEFYKYDDGFLHEKAMLIDDAAAAIGTANFDNRSFRLNFEITALVIDPDFVSRVEAMFEADFAKSRLVPPDEYTGKSFWFRLGVRLARLTSPVL